MKDLVLIIRVLNLLIFVVKRNLKEIYFVSGQHENFAEAFVIVVPEFQNILEIIAIINFGFSPRNSGFSP